MDNALMVQNNQIIRTVDDASRVAKAMALSGYFADAKDISQAMVKVMAGQEMGVGAFASMSGIHIIKGKPAMGGNLIASLIKNDPRYNYKILSLDNSGCEIEFFENGESQGVSSFKEADAKAAGLLGNDNYKKFTRNMYFNRAISNGAKWYVPGIFGGVPVYTPGELSGEQVDDDGDVIESVVIEPNFPNPEMEPSKPLPPVEAKQEAAPKQTATKSGGITTKEGTPYEELTGEELSNRFNSISKVLKKDDLTAEQRAEYKAKQDRISEIFKERREAEEA